MWHELVLAGIGGQTIAEAKQNLTVLEYNDWLEYRARYGSLNPNRRLEQVVGGLSSLVAQLAGAKNVDPIDFMPHETTEGTEMPLSEIKKIFLGG